MITFEVENRVLRETLQTRIKNLERPAEIDVHLSEFDDVKYRIQASAKDPQHMTISLSLPPAAADVSTASGLPPGGIEAVQSTFESLVEVLPTPEEGYRLTLRINLQNLPADPDERGSVISKLASLRFIVMAAPLRNILSNLLKDPPPASEGSLPIALMHRPSEAFYAIPQAEQVTVVFPMRFRDSNDVILATAFLQEFMEARRSSGLSTAPSCTYSPNPPLELKNINNNNNNAPAHTKNANAGYVSFVIFPRHIEKGKLEKTAWLLSTFYAYVSYHIKCSKAFMHTRMRRRVDSLIQLLNRAKPDVEKEKKTAHGRSFKRAI